MGGKVRRLRVLLDHPVGVEVRTQLPDRRLHHRDPGARKPPAVPIVEQGDDLVLEKVVEGLALHPVLLLRVAVRLAAADRPAEIGGVPLVPPPVEDRNVQRAVGRRLHPARPRRFQRAPRVVQPHVDTLHHIPRHVDVVILKEDQPVANPRVRREMDDRPDDLLRGDVLRVRLAGEEDLHRPVRVRQEPDQAIGLPEEQVGPLVGCEPPGEADRQRSRGSAPLPPPSGAPSRRPGGGAGFSIACGRRRRAAPCGTGGSARAPRGGSPPPAPTPRGPRASRGTASPKYRVYSSTISWLSQERVWIPLVIARIGTSASGSSGHRSFHIAREVSCVEFRHAVGERRRPEREHRHPEILEPEAPDWPRARIPPTGSPAAGSSDRGISAAGPDRTARSPRGRGYGW